MRKADLSQLLFIVVMGCVLVMGIRSHQINEELKVENKTLLSKLERVEEDFVKFAVPNLLYVHNLLKCFIYVKDEYTDALEAHLVTNSPSEYVTTKTNNTENYGN